MEFREFSADQYVRPCWLGLLLTWAQAPQAVPTAWTEQVHPGGIIVAPLRRRTAQVVRLRVLSTHQLAEEQIAAAAALGRRQPCSKLITASI